MLPGDGGKQRHIVHDKDALQAEPPAVLHCCGYLGNWPCLGADLPWEFVLANRGGGLRRLRGARLHPCGMGPRVLQYDCNVW